jgi:hypothetical protein
MGGASEDRFEATPRRLEEAEEIGAVTVEPATVPKEEPRSHRGALRGAN